MRNFCSAGRAMANSDSESGKFGEYQNARGRITSYWTMTIPNRFVNIQFGKGSLDVELYRSEFWLELRLPGTAYTLWSGSPVDFTRWIRSHLRLSSRVTSSERRKISDAPNKPTRANGKTIGTYFSRKRPSRRRNK